MKSYQERQKAKEFEEELKKIEVIKEKNKRNAKHIP